MVNCYKFVLFPCYLVHLALLQPLGVMWGANIFKTETTPAKKSKDSDTEIIVKTESDTAAATAAPNLSLESQFSGSTDTKQKAPEAPATSTAKVPIDSGLELPRSKSGKSEKSFKSEKSKSAELKSDDSSLRSESKDSTLEPTKTVTSKSTAAPAPGAFLPPTSSSPAPTSAGTSTIAASTEEKSESLPQASTLAPASKPANSMSAGTAAAKKQSEVVRAAPTSVLAAAPATAAPPAATKEKSQAVSVSPALTSVSAVASKPAVSTAAAKEKSDAPSPALTSVSAAAPATAALSTVADAKKDSEKLIKSTHGSVPDTVTSSPVSAVTVPDTPVCCWPLPSGGGRKAQNSAALSTSTPASKPDSKPVSVSEELSVSGTTDISKSGISKSAAGSPAIDTVRSDASGKIQKEVAVTPPKVLESQTKTETSPVAATAKPTASDPKTSEEVSLTPAEIPKTVISGSPVANFKSTASGPETSAAAAAALSMTHPVTLVPKFQFPPGAVTDSLSDSEFVRNFDVVMKRDIYSEKEFWHRQSYNAFYVHVSLNPNSEDFKHVKDLKDNTKCAIRVTDLGLPGVGSSSKGVAIGSKGTSPEIKEIITFHNSCFSNFASVNNSNEGIVEAALALGEEKKTESKLNSNGNLLVQLNGDHYVFPTAEHLILASQTMLCSECKEDGEDSEEVSGGRATILRELGFFANRSEKPSRDMAAVLRKFAAANKDSEKPNNGTDAKEAVNFFRNTAYGPKKFNNTFGLWNFQPVTRLISASIQLLKFAQDDEKRKFLLSTGYEFII